MEQTIPRRIRIISKQISGTQSPAINQFIPLRMVDENAFDFDFVIRSSGTFDLRIIAWRWLDGDIQGLGVGEWRRSVRGKVGVFEHHVRSNSHFRFRGWLKAVRRVSESSSSWWDERAKAEREKEFPKDSKFSLQLVIIISASTRELLWTFVHQNHHSPSSQELWSLAKRNLPPPVNSPNFWGYADIIDNFHWRRRQNSW